MKPAQLNFSSQWTPLWFVGCIRPIVNGQLWPVMDRSENTSSANRDKYVIVVIIIILAKPVVPCEWQISIILQQATTGHVLYRLCWECYRMLSRCLATRVPNCWNPAPNESEKVELGVQSGFKIGVQNWGQSGLEKGCGCLGWRHRSQISKSRLGLLDSTLPNSVVHHLYA